MPGYSGGAMVKGAFRQPNTSSEPLLDLELVAQQDSSRSRWVPVFNIKMENQAEGVSCGLMKG